MRGFFIEFGREKEHAAALKRGLADMHPDFTGRLCPICEGLGNYRQSYTAGCGGGYYRSTGPCDYCGKTGLLQGGKPAAESVVIQVLVAAEKGGASDAHAG
jgi:hypothetical protein